MPCNTAFFHSMIPLEMCIIRSDLSVIYANKALTNSTGIHDFSGRKIETIFSKEDLEEIEEVLKKTKDSQGEVRCLMKNIIADTDREIVFRYEAESDSFYMVLMPALCVLPGDTNDALTGLNTREIFIEKTKQLMLYGEREKTKLALVFLDLNGFKPVNDTYGHKAGDTVLKVVAQRLQESIRKSDTLARFGGDEFVIGISGLKAGIHSSLSVRRIMKNINLPIDIEETEVCVSGSFGISIYPDDSEDITTLIRYADEAMYKAKTRNLGYAFFNSPEDSLTDIKQ